MLPAQSYSEISETPEKRLISLDKRRGDDNYSLEYAIAQKGTKPIMMPNNGRDYHLRTRELVTRARGEELLVGSPHWFQAGTRYTYLNPETISEAIVSVIHYDGIGQDSDWSVFTILFKDATTSELYESSIGSGIEAPELRDIQTRLIAHMGAQKVVKVHSDAEIEKACAP